MSLYIYSYIYISLNIVIYRYIYIIYIIVIYNILYIYYSYIVIPLDIVISSQRAFEKYLMTIWDAHLSI